MAGLKTPIISVVLGEGGSGGALGIGVADRVLMLEHAIYSVISPEGCASILWRDAGRAENAADALKLTAQNLMEFGIIDEIIAEPDGGAHNDPLAIADSIKQSVIKHISQLKKMSVERLVSQRYQRLRKIGAYQ
jgi:acetyl-CoA carboxylase carboxyl transferase subunit alpha